MFDDYIRLDSTPLYTEATGRSSHLHLLWGDGVQVLEPGPTRTKVRARWRWRTGYVDNAALGGRSLLELYFIDVGQGDGVLIKTPDFRHVMIDGGYRRAFQDTGKNAADFVDWKFYQDYSLGQIRLEAMIASHCDADHYGGLWDLLDVAQSRELDAVDVRVQDFYHAGIAWWESESGGRGLGPYAARPEGTYFTRLLGDRAAVEAALAVGARPRLQGWWRQFLEKVAKARWTDGRPTRIRRLSDASGYLPGFEPGTGEQPAIKVLGPVEFAVDGRPAIRRYPGGNSQNTNGNSLLLRLDYGRVRVLLTGDLNRRSQAALLADYTGRRQELQCDVAKACHHGSDDVSYAFLQAMRPAVTVISSGDNEGYAHPRPSIVAASATTGYLDIRGDELVSPLVYSTELARSVSFGHPYRLDEKSEAGQVIRTLEDVALRRAMLHFAETKAGELRPRQRQRRLGSLLVVAGLVYGLVNVRSDGERILCATRSEKDHTWQIQTLTSRF